MTLKIWDKKTDINGVSAEDYLREHPEINSGEHIVISYNDESLRAEEVFNVDTIKSILKTTKNTAPIDIIEEYIIKRNKENEEAKKNIITENKRITEYGERIAQLEYDLLMKDMTVSE